MKNYTIQLQQVSKERNRSFNLLINGQNCCEISVNKPSFGSDYGAERFKEVLFEDAYQTARRIIIHSFENDIDVFTKGLAKMDFGDHKVKRAQ